MKRPILLACAVASTQALSACVTINIYFPAAAAEKAADRIIDEVWQLNEAQKGEATKPATGADTPAGANK